MVNVLQGMPTYIHDAAYSFAFELLMARKKHGPFLSAHEGYAVILEELEEVWQIIKTQEAERDYEKLRKEIVQCGAMCLAFLIEIVDTENRR